MGTCTPKTSSGFKYLYVYAKSIYTGTVTPDFIVALAYNFDYLDPTSNSGTSTRRPRSTRPDQEFTQEQFDWLTSSTMMNDFNIDLDDSAISGSSAATSPASSSPGPRFWIGLQLYTHLGSGPRMANAVQQGSSYRSCISHASATARRPTPSQHAAIPLSNESDA